MKPGNKLVIWDIGFKVLLRHYIGVNGLFVEAAAYGLICMQ